MKKLIVAAAAIALFAGGVFAHPAKSIELTITGTRVDINVVHQVKDPAKHYIDQIEVLVDGKKLVTQAFTLQKDMNGQAATYIIPEIKPGSKVKVITNCNKGGKLTVEKKAQ